MIRLHHIVEATAHVTGWPVSRVLGGDKVREIVRARQCGFKASREIGFKLTEIGDGFSRNHATINYGIGEIVRRGDISEARTIREIKSLASVLADEITAVPFKTRRVDPCVFRTTRNSIAAHERRTTPQGETV